MKTIDYGNGDTYVGQTKLFSNVRHGKGTLSSLTQTYEGSFKNDKRCGYGELYDIFKLPLYKGDWKDDLYDGSGELFLNIKNFGRGGFKGSFKAGKPSGRGVFSNDYLVCECELCDNQIKGQCKIKYKNGSVKGNGEFEGEYDSSTGVAIGTHTNSNGDVYEGELLDFKRNGTGKLTIGDTLVYEGEWKNGLYHGQGRLTYQDGGTYVGAFAYGRREGEGNYVSSNGKGASGYWYMGVLVEERNCGKEGKSTENAEPSSKKRGEKERSLREDSLESFKSALEAQKKAFETREAFLKLQKEKNLDEEMLLLSAKIASLLCSASDAVEKAIRCAMTEEITNSSWYGVIKYDDFEYKGDIRLLKPHGVGELEINGAKFTAEFKEGKINGYVEAEYPDGSIFRGSAIEGVEQGFCTIFYDDMTRYEGENYKKNPSGYGRLITEAAKYEGEFKGPGEKCIGYMIQKNCEIFGEVIDGKFTGYGMICENGTLCYAGELCDGNMHGFGVQYGDGVRICTTFENGKRVGCGTYREYGSAELCCIFDGDTITPLGN